MKKIVIVAGLVAISMMALGQQQASAWVNSRFGVGLNWERQSGGNNFFWGGYRNGQVPAPDGFGGQPSFGPTMSHADASQGYAPQTYAQTPQVYPAQSATPYAGQYESPFQFANYPRPVYYYPAPVYYYYVR